MTNESKSAHGWLVFKNVFKVCLYLLRSSHWRGGGSYQFRFVFPLKRIPMKKQFISSQVRCRCRRLKSIICFFHSLSFSLKNDLFWLLLKACNQTEWWRSKSQKKILFQTLPPSKTGSIEKPLSKITKNTKFRQNEEESWRLRGPWITPKLVVTSELA